MERVSDMVSLEQAESLSGLPQELVAVLAACQRIPSEERLSGRLYVSRAALIGWCNLYGRILQYVANHASPQEQVYGGCSPFELVWMSRNGMLEGKERGSVRA
jgi:hypothetical protein